MSNSRNVLVLPWWFFLVWDCLNDLDQSARSDYQDKHLVSDRNVLYLVLSRGSQMIEKN